MQPTISRETVLIDVDRRQPGLRWSAVFAGAVCSVGFWILLQLLGLGFGLAAVRSVESLRDVSAGTTAWSLISPLIAMFFGGLLAGRLARTYDRKVAGVHGLVMWAITSIVGLCATLWLVTMIVAGAARASGAAIDATGHMMPGSGDAEVRAPTLRELGINGGELVGSINQRLAAEGKPTITVAQFEAAVRGMVQTGLARGDFDQELLIDPLVAHTSLSRPDAIEVERQVEARLDPLDTRPHHLERRTERFLVIAVDASGRALAAVGVALLLSLITSVIGAMIGLRRPPRAGEGGPQRGVRTTEPGGAPPDAEPWTTTSPATGATGMTAPPSPVIPPHDVNGP